MIEKRGKPAFTKILYAVNFASLGYVSALLTASKLLGKTMLRLNTMHIVALLRSLEHAGGRHMARNSCDHYQSAYDFVFVGLTVPPVRYA